MELPETGRILASRRHEKYKNKVWIAESSHDRRHDKLLRGKDRDRTGGSCRLIIEYLSNVVEASYAIRPLPWYDWGLHETLLKRRRRLLGSESFVKTLMRDGRGQAIVRDEDDEVSNKYWERLVQVDPSSIFNDTYTRYYRFSIEFCGWNVLQKVSDQSIVRISDDGPPYLTIPDDIVHFPFKIHLPSVTRRFVSLQY